MRLLRDLLIRRKVTLIMMMTSTVTLLVACLAWFLFDRAEYRRTLVDELRLVGGMIEAAVAPAVDFEDVEAMEQGLFVLSSQAHIRQARLFDRDGMTLVSYLSTDNSGAAKELDYRRAGHFFGDDSLVLYHPVRWNREYLGTVAIEADMSAMVARQLKFAGICALVLLFALIAAYLTSVGLRDFISGPVLRLTETVHAVSECEDYSLRAHVYGKDELGYLTNAFNGMLARIEDRDRQLELHRTTLEEKVALRTQELTRLNAQLRESTARAEAATIAKSRFLANMSHEIRTPMNGVLGMNDLLLDSGLSEKQRGYAVVVKHSAESLLGIINDILDFSKIEAGKVQLEEIEFEPVRIVEEVVDLLANNARGKGLDLACWVSPSIPRVLCGDPTRLRQILTNLVANAIKFTEHGSVVVRLLIDEQGNDDCHVRFEVQDSGIGVPRSSLKELFSAFSQADSSTTRRFGGTGLGLAISRHFAELMGGTIGVESEVGVGSTFWFCARLRCGSQEPWGGAELADELADLRLLVVEESPTLREILHQQLGVCGVEHRVTEDLDQALELIRRASDGPHPFRLVLIDERRLEYAGERIEQVFAKLPVRPELVVSGWQGDVGEREPDDTQPRLSKPIRPSRLVRLLRGRANAKDTLAGGGAPAAKRAVVEKAPARPAAARSLRVLLAEDNDVNQLVASKILSKGGYAHRAVKNGREAIEAVCERGGFDVVLMDCQMPELDGFEATGFIRQWERKAGRDAPPIHIIALTANAMKGDREMCIEAGMNDYLSKPVRPEALLGKLAALERLQAKAAAAGEPFDAQRLLARYAAGSEDERDAIERFEELCGELLVRLEACLNAEDLGEARSLSEGMCARADLLDSSRLPLLASALGEQALEGCFDEALRCLRELRAEIDRCCAYLPVVLAKAS